MKKFIFFFSVLSLFVFCKTPTKTIVETQGTKIEPSPKSRDDQRGDLRFVNYNVENLYDTYDDTTKDDEEFLPWGLKGWNKERYNQKLKNIFKVLVNVGGWEMPEIVAVQEIENRRVLEDLINLTPMSEYKYGVIHEDSPDNRGVDVGFLYRRDKFTPLQHGVIRIKFPFDTLVKTRDILMVKGLVNKMKDTVTIFVFHSPSRRGGEVASEPRRVYVAEQARIRIDSILNRNPESKIILLGDFNDEPDNKSILDVLRGKGEINNLQQGDMYNFMYDLKMNKGLGTYKFQEFWNCIDNLIISQGLLSDKSTTYCKPNSGQIFTADWLVAPDDQAPGVKPIRTYSGPQYLGGFSDHLPVYLDLYFR
jgi:predicted extracellular nuclease